MKETFIGPHPPQDGKEWDCQCVRCGSQTEWQDCDDCHGEGYYDEDDWDGWNQEGDTCRECKGYGGFNVCGASMDYCKDNPMPGREKETMSELEWFVVKEPA